MKQVFKKLNNKPEVYYIPFPKKSEKVYLDILIKEGTVHDTKEKLGLTHLLEHYLLAEFDEISEFKTKNNGGVSPEDSYFYIQSTRQDIIKDSEIFLKSILQKNSFKNKSLLEKEKRTILNEFQDNINDSQDKIANAFKKATLGEDCPFAKGYKEESKTVKKLDLGDLKKRHKSLFTNQKIIITIGGANLPEEKLNKLVSCINDLNLPDPSAPKYKTCKLKKQEFRKINIPEIEGSYSCLMLPGPNLESSLGDRILSRLACRYLTDFSNTNIFKKLRDMGIYSLENKRYFYRKFGLINLFANTTRKDIPAFFKIILEGIEDIKKKGINKDILKREIDHFLERDKEEWGLNLGRYEWVADDLLCINKVEDLKETSKFIKSIDNNLIMNWAKKYLKLNSITFATVGNKNEIKNLKFNPKE